MAQPGMVTELKHSLPGSLGVLSLCLVNGRGSIAKLTATVSCCLEHENLIWFNKRSSFATSPGNAKRLGGGYTKSVSQSMDTTC